MQGGLVQAPVDAQAVLLPLHASLALASVQRAGEPGCPGALPLDAGPRAQLHAAVPRHTLPQRAQARAARVIAGAAVPGTQAVTRG